MIDPFTEKEQTVLSDVYDAEIAYQDRQLRRLFRALKRSGEMDNTMVVIVSDHGESHGEHSFMGHAFVNYNEIVRVPLVIRYPDKFPAGHRVKHSISTRRLFHTILDAAGIDHEAYGFSVDDLTLARSVNGKDAELDDEYVVAEAYPPLNFINVMQMNNPDAIEPFRVQSLRRSIYNSHTKLMTIDGQLDEFFDIEKDYFELENLVDNPFGYENELLNLQKRLEEFVVINEAHRDGTAAGAQIDYSNNPEILERLRNLGYIE